MDQLWGATYDLDTWYFIGRGSLSNLIPMRDYFLEMRRAG